jgi:hypothetical protein
MRLDLLIPQRFHFYRLLRQLNLVNEAHVRVGQRMQEVVQTVVGLHQVGMHCVDSRAKRCHFVFAPFLKHRRLHAGVTNAVLQIYRVVRIALVQCFHVSFSMLLNRAKHTLSALIRTLLKLWQQICVFLDKYLFDKECFRYGKTVHIFGHEEKKLRSPSRENVMLSDDVTTAKIVSQGVAVILNAMSTSVILEPCTHFSTLDEVHFQNFLTFSVDNALRIKHSICLSNESRLQTVSHPLQNAYLVIEVRSEELSEI